jgi:PmbA protein
VLAASNSLSVARRLGAIEHLERAEGFDLGLRVFVGQRQAIVSSTDPDRAGFAALAERAVAMARAVPEDRFAGLPEFAPVPVRALDLDDPAEPSAEDLLSRAAEAEEAALATAGVTNSSGAEAGFNRSRIAILASNGFAGEYSRSSHSVSVSALAGQGTGMERDYDQQRRRASRRSGGCRHARPPGGGAGGEAAQPDPAGQPQAERGV